MARLEEHPTVRRFRAEQARRLEPAPRAALDSQALRRRAIELGADDVGFVRIDRAEIADQRDEIVAVLPGAVTLISFVVRMQRESIRAPSRSLANVEFHHAGGEVNEVGRRLAEDLERQGHRALNATMGFPMEADRWPGKMWVVSHKPVAVAAGLGQMGIHRNVIHPRFGNFIALGTVLLDSEVSEASRPVEFNPCLECKLCVAACPTGAISPAGDFNFSACYTHNYREFMGGFGDWVETIVESRDRFDYRHRVSDPETVSMWQSLGMGPNYKAAYCMAVCPAGEDVIAPFLTDRPGFLRAVVKPLQDKQETVYVLAESDAEAHVRERFPHKRPKRVHSGLRPATIAGFLRGMPLTFQPGRAAGLAATYHFMFTGEEVRSATVEIRNRTLKVSDGLVGVPDLRLEVDSRTWLRFLAREVGLAGSLLRGRIRFRGSPRLLLAFGRCFPS